MKVKINNFYIIIYFVLMILMNQSIGLSYINLVSLLFLSVLLKNIKINRCLPTSIYFIYISYAIIITVLNSGSGDISWYRIHINLCGLLIMCFLTSMFLTKQANIDLFCARIRSFSWVLLIGGIFEYITKFNITRFMRNSDYVETYLDREGRILSIFYHPLGYAAFLLLLFILFLYYPYKDYKKHFTINILLITNLLFTKSRSALIILMFIWIIFKIKHLNKLSIRIPLKKIYGIIGAIIGLLVLITIFRNTISVFAISIYKRFMSLGIENKEGIRTLIILNFINYLKNSPFQYILFGHGIGYSYNFMKLYPITYRIDGKINLWSQTTDNTYISIILDYGLVGFLIFVFLIITIIKTFIFCKNKKVEMASLILISLFILLFIMEGLYWPTIMFTYAFSFGIMEKTKSNNRSINKQGHRRKEII